MSLILRLLMSAMLTACLVSCASLSAITNAMLSGVPAQESAAEAEVLPAPAVVSGDIGRGLELFRSRQGDVPACSSCHASRQGAFIRGAVLAPTMVGISQRAGSRISGMSAEQYLHDSIVNPSAFVVFGYNDNMYKHYGDVFSEQDIADLIAYLMTL